MREHGTIRAVLLDVEGTTTPLSFVKDVLFPYARERVGSLVLRDSDPDLAELRREYESDPTPGKPPWEGQDGPGAYLQFLMEADRKSTGLKALQGRIWEEGYRRGELRGEVFEDVRGALERWALQGRRAAIYSSGSVLAQELLFSSTPLGDLRPFIRAYFDTRVGPKTAEESYLKIAAALALPPKEVLFISDAPSELEAAQKAGMEVLLCERSGSGTKSTFPVVASLTGLFA